MASLISFHKSARLPRLIVTDLDGTLLTPQYTLTPRTIAALSLAQSYRGPLTPPAAASVLLDRGGNGTDVPDRDRRPIQVMLASGRSPRLIKMAIDMFGGVMIPDAVICSNGALNYDPRTQIISNPQFLPLDQALFMVQGLRAEICGHGTPKSEIHLGGSHLGQDLGQEGLKPLAQDHQDKDDPLFAGRPAFACEVIWYEGLSPSGEPIYAQDTSFHCERAWELQRKHLMSFEYTVISDTMEAFIQSLQQASETPNGRTGGIVNLMALDRNRTSGDVYKSLPESLRVMSPSSMAAGTAPMASTTAVTPSPTMAITYACDFFLEIAAAGVTKGLGLAKYCEAHGIAREDVVAFGDLLNDATMLEFAGLGLCMGNGHEEMKKLADRVIGTNTEDGVAQEIESWFV